MIILSHGRIRASVKCDIKNEPTMGDPITIGSVLTILFRTILILLPAMTANTFAPFLGGGAPVDMGKTRRDGRRYLGDGKTWRGFIGGSTCAALLGFLILVMMDSTGIASFEDSLWGPTPHNVILISAMAVGSLFGDMLGSFIKRALNRPRGKRTPLLDQWDYLIGAALFILPFYPWWMDALVQGQMWIGLASMPLIAWLAHTIANRIGYWIGVKKEPW